MTPDTKGPWIALYTRTMASKDFLRLSCAERSVFLQALLLAARVDRIVTVAGERYHVKPGQFVIGRKALAELCGPGCSEKIVRRTIAKLVAAGTWASERANTRANAPTRVTFINWSVYQLPPTSRANERANTRANAEPETSQQSTSQDLLHGIYTIKIKDKRLRPQPLETAQKDDDAAKVLSLYRTICVPAGLRDVRGMTRTRHAIAVKAVERYGLTEVEQLLRKAMTSAFLRGQSVSASHPTWRPDFDFLLKPDTLVYIAEGSRYFDTPARPKIAATFRQPLGADHSAFEGVPDFRAPSDRAPTMVPDDILPEHP